MDESRDEDKTTLWVRGSSAFPLVPKEPSFALVPKDRSSDSKAAPAVSKTLRPLESGFGESPLAYVLSTLALAVAGVALYYARALPFEPARAAAPPATKTVDVAPAPPPPAAPVVAPPAVSAAHPVPPASSKPAIDVMSLPTAPPASRVRSAPTR